MRRFTLEELEQYDGQDGRPAYIVFEGRKGFTMSREVFSRSGTGIKFVITPAGSITPASMARRVGLS